MRNALKVLLNVKLSALIYQTAGTIVEYAT